MNFKECIAQKMLIDLGRTDCDEAKELLALAEHKLLFWKEVNDKAISYPSLFIEGHYEIIKELATAVLAIDGWRSENHDCVFQYLLEKKNIEIDALYITDLRKLRNKIDYHGTKVSFATWKQNELQLNLIIAALREYLGGRLGVC